MTGWLALSSANTAPGPARAARQAGKLGPDVITPKTGAGSYTRETTTCVCVLVKLWGVNSCRTLTLWAIVGG